MTTLNKIFTFTLLAIFCGLVLKAQQYKNSENYSKLDKHNQWAILGLAQGINPCAKLFIN